MTAPGTTIDCFSRATHSCCEPFTNGGSDSLDALLCAFGHVIDSVLCNGCNLADLIAKNGPLESKTAHGKADGQERHPHEDAPEIAWWLKAAKGRKEAAYADDDKQQANGGEDWAE